MPLQFSSEMLVIARVCTLQTGLSTCEHWLLGLKQKKNKNQNPKKTVPKDFRMMSASVKGVDDGGELRLKQGNRAVSSAPNMQEA